MENLVEDVFRSFVPAAAERVISETERFVVLPLFLVVPLLFGLLGVRTIRTKTFRLRKAWLYGHREATGRVAVAIGCVHLTLACAMAAGIVTMMVLGRPLL